MDNGGWHGHVTVATVVARDRRVLLVEGPGNWS